LGGPV
jgi:hypothetical protein